MQNSIYKIKHLLFLSWHWEAWCLTVWEGGLIPPRKNTAWNKGRKCFHCLGAPNNLIRPCLYQFVTQLALVKTGQTEMLKEYIKKRNRVGKQGIQEIRNAKICSLCWTNGDILPYLSKYSTRNTVLLHNSK